MYNFIEKNDYSNEIEEGSHKHEPLDEEPDSLLELLELFLHAASFSILNGGWLETGGSFPPTMSTSSSISKSPVIGIHQDY